MATVFGFETMEQRIYLQIRHGGYTFAEIARGTEFSRSQIESKYRTLRERVTDALNS